MDNYVRASEVHIFPGRRVVPGVTEKILFDVVFYSFWLQLPSHY